MSTFAALLRSRRDSLGMTLDEVAAAAGIAKSHLHGLETGKHDNPGLYTCTRLAVALGLQVQLMAAALLEQRASAETTP